MPLHTSGLFTRENHDSIHIAGQSVDLGRRCLFQEWCLTSGMLIPDKRVNPTSPVHIPYTYNRRGNVAADLQTVFVVFCAVLPSWCQADSSMSYVFYAHGSLEKVSWLFAVVKSCLQILDVQTNHGSMWAGFRRFEHSYVYRPCVPM